METERERKREREVLNLENGRQRLQHRQTPSAMIEFAVEDILFEDMEAAATSEDARSGLILPSMTIDPADTKTPYSDATQVGMRYHKRAAARLGQRATIRTWPTELRPTA